MTLQQIKSLCNENIMPTYLRYELAIEKGKGATAMSFDGRQYIDFGSGIGVNSLGYCEQGWVQSVTEQLLKVQHISNYYYNETQVRLAQRLVEVTGLDKVFLCNSGAEANECAIKLARKYSFNRYGGGRHEIITLLNSFHGRTVTTLSATGQPDMHNYFFPFTEGFSHADAGCIESVKQLTTDKTCAVMIEVVQGEGGVVLLDNEFITRLYEHCRQNGLLLICDEVQTGVGRTGKFLAMQHFDIKPDIVTLAKGLASGLPIGACLCSKELGQVMSYGQHGSTFGGNPVCCAGALYVLEKVCDKDFLKEVEKKGQYIRDKIKSMPRVSNVRGMGLMIGFEVEGFGSKDIALRCLENGLLVLTAKNAVRLLPPLNITYGEIDKGLDILEKVLVEIDSKGGSRK